MVQEFKLTNSSRRSAANKSRGLSNSDHVFHNIAGGSGTPKAKVATTAKAQAEKAIPLEGQNSGSDDFEGFNS